MRSLWLGLAAGLGFWCAPVSAETDPSRSVDAMAFIRVVGDLRLEYHDARQVAVRKNIELMTGSGFVVAPSGLVITNMHVVDTEGRLAAEGLELSIESARVEVFVGDQGSGGQWEAHIVASDAVNDLAALQVTAGDLPYLPLGDSDAVEAGRAVQVLGFPYGRDTELAKRVAEDVVPQVSVTAGSLSASRADDAGETRLLQTDASVHPGSSGGPMLDEDGYVVGVVRMRLRGRGDGGPGPGFTVPVNVVKDFLDANGLLERLPAVRLRPGVRHSLDWKQVAIELPDGYTDRSASRVSVDAGELGDVGVRVDRWQTPWRAAALEEALLGGDAVRGFVPGPATPGPRIARPRDADRDRPAPALATGKAASLIGSAVGTDDAGNRFRVEYAIVDLPGEKVVARYLGPADAVAFNLGLVRRSLRSLEAGGLLQNLPLQSVAAAAGSSLEPAPFSVGEGGVLLPRAWTREPATSSACAALPAAEAGVLARHPSDYSLVLRALRWRRAGSSLGSALSRCGARSPARASAASGAGAAGSTYAFQFERLGVAIAVRGELVTRGSETLLLELEAPVAKLPIVEELYAGWVGQVAAAKD